MRPRPNQAVRSSKPLVPSPLFMTACVLGMQPGAAWNLDHISEACVHKF